MILFPNNPFSQGHVMSMSNCKQCWVKERWWWIDKAEQTHRVRAGRKYCEIVGVQKTRKVITLVSISLGDDGDNQGIGKPHGFL